jgi:predicted GNAT family N-acyltransferase
MIDKRPPANVEIQRIQVEATLPLRLSVLRPGRPVESARFDGDEVACHFGAFKAGQLLGIASLYRVGMPGRPGVSAFQLRGMATAPEARGSGLGRALVKGCVAFALEEQAQLIWCNARTSAVDFYRKMGFSISGGEFEIPDVGPHFRMFFELGTITMDTSGL